MDPTTIRVISGILFVVIVFVILLWKLFKESQPPPPKQGNFVRPAGLSRVLSHHV